MRSIKSDAHKIKSRPFKKKIKLIRDFDPKQANLAGLGAISAGPGYGVDDVATAAIEAGYLRNSPDAIAYRTALITGSEVPDITNALREAIAQELAGNPDYSQDIDTDQSQQQYDDAEQYLSSLGVSLDDPIEKIRAAVDASGSAFGSSYAQSDGGADEQPIARLTGKELFDFKSGDMKEARNVAVEWYKNNLQNTTATMANGTVVAFNKAGRSKSTYGKLDHIRLSAIQSIKAIIEKGKVVHREPGNKPHIIERIVVSAPVEIDGKIFHFALGVHQTNTGHFHYDINLDKNYSHTVENGAGALRITRSDADHSTSGSLSADTSELNIFEVPPEINLSSDNADITKPAAPKTLFQKPDKSPRGQIQFPEGGLGNGLSGLLPIFRTRG